MTAAVNFCPDYLTICWDDGQNTKYPCAWLIDNQPGIKDLGTGQYLRDISNANLDAKIIDASVQTDELHVKFTDFDVTYALPTFQTELAKPPNELQYWRDGIALYDADFAGLQNSEDGLHPFLQALSQYGCVRVHNAPTHDGAVCDIAAKLGIIHETNYGRYFDVKAQIDPINLAYTGMKLTPHTDNPYREPVPAYQILLCIENTTDGGETVLVDGFAHADALRKEDPAAFDLLNTTAIEFSFIGDAKESLHTTRPIIETDLDGEIIAVHVNERARQPLAHSTSDEFYHAYQNFLKRLYAPKNHTQLRLQSGESYIVNNRRILHGRTAFSAGGQRHLQGCYVLADGPVSKLNILNGT